jgi:hypothetical protein
MGEVALSLLGWLVLCQAAWLQSRDTVPKWGALEWSVVAGLALLAATQALPLPPHATAVLPGRQTIQADLDLAGLAGAWRPLSLDASATFRALAATLPAVAMLVCTRAIYDKGWLTLCRWLVGLACVSVVLGIMQVAGGAESPFRLGDFHNLTGALGFFTYRNHQAAFLLMVVPVAVALLLIRDVPSLERTPRSRRVLPAAAVAILLLGIPLTYSRAGVVLGLAMLGGCVALAWSARGARAGWRWVPAVAGAATAGILMVVWAASGTVAWRFGEGLLEDARWSLYRRVAEIGSTYQPPGAGLGAFEQVFQAAPENVALMGAYMNHAHNEWLQLWLELGWAGALAALVAVAFLGRAALKVWRRDVQSRSPAAVMLARAASISLAVGLVHAYFDYALRSGTTIVVFSLLVALLVREGYPEPKLAGERRIR